MSERGIEIHNGEVVFPEGMPQTIHIGTLALPLTQGEAAQVVLSAVINALALGGAVYAGLFSVHGSVSLTGSLTGLRARTVVDAAIIVTGYAYGIHIEQEVHAAGQLTLTMDGIRLEQYVPTGGLTHTVHGIFITNYIQEQPSSNYYFMRCAENGGVTLDACMMFSLGSGSDATLFLHLASANTAWSNADDKTGGATAGWIKCNVGGVDKYIQLYTA